MKDLQRIPPGQQIIAATATPVLPVTPLPVSEIPGAGLKRDYAGVLEYWQMIRRHPGLVILAALLGAVFAFLSTLPDPRIYQARATLEIQGLNEDFLNMKSVNPTVDASSNFSPDYDIQTQVKILQSRSLIKRVRAKLQAQKRVDNLQPPDRIASWRKALKIDPPTQDVLWQQAIAIAAGSVRVKSSATNRIVEISTDSTNAQIAADFVNTLAAEYMDQNLEARWQSTEHTGEWLTRQLQDLKVKLETAEEQLQSYARSTGLVFTDEKDNVEDAKLSDLQKQLSTAQADRVDKQSRYEMAKATPPDALPGVFDQAASREFAGRLADLEGQLARLEVQFTPNHAEVKRVQAQIDAMKATQAAAEGTDASIILTRIRSEYESALRREKLLSAAYASQSHLVSAKAEQAAHYNLLKRDVDASRLLYETMLQKLKEASIASALRASNVRVVDPAERPQIPYKPDVRRSISVGLLAGLCMGVVIVVLRERADRTLQDPGDPAYYLNLAELGVVPIGNLLDARATKRPASQTVLRIENGKATEDLNDERMELISWNRKSSLLAESFRTTLTSILFSGQNGDRPRLLVFTSASPKEGKTTVVSNIGISLAEIHHNVLVIDADMRRPRMHTVFDVSNEKGLSDLLFEDKPLDAAALEAACLPTAIPRLYVMPSGGSRHNASSLVHSPRLAELMKLARERFDTVIIDTPPMVNISDARVVARLADAVILILRSASTTRDAALLAKRRFAEDGIQLLGVILNYWNPKTPGYGYYRYYYAGYYSYYGQGNGNGHGHESSDGAEAVDLNENHS